MSRVLFQNSYVTVIPTYNSTEQHKHSMLHVFFGNRSLTIEVEGINYVGNVIFVRENVLHRAPAGVVSCFLLIDPTSFLAEQIHNKYLREQTRVAISSVGCCELMNNYSDEEIQAKVVKLLEPMSFVADIPKEMDARISSLVKNIRNYKYLEKRVSEIAEDLNYSESWLVHLFKRETGISLKSYLIIRQLEYVWKSVIDGGSITEASMEAGYSSPSHFAAICKQLTGISLSDVLR